MLHFDLLRLFGPVMQVDQSAYAIPYMTSADQKIQDFLKADVVIENIINDLSASSELLHGVDPILTEREFRIYPLQQVTTILTTGNIVLITMLCRHCFARAYLWKGIKSQL